MDGTHAATSLTFWRFAVQDCRLSIIILQVRVQTQSADSWLSTSLVTALVLAGDSLVSSAQGMFTSSSTASFRNRMLQAVLAGHRQANGWPAQQQQPPPNGENLEFIT
jgi:hypothetical protein